MNPQTPDKKYDCPHCNASFSNAIGKPSCHFDLEMTNGRTKLCVTAEALIKQNNEVARLKEMVVDAAKRGDEMTAHWKERAERAETLIKQLHHLAELLPEASKTQLPHTNSMSTNADNLKMTTSNDNEVARLRGLLKDHATFLRENGFAYRAEELMRGFAPAPEEPVTGLCLICHEKQTTCSSGLCEECQKPEEPVTENSSSVESEKTPICITCNSDKQVWRDEDWRNEYICHRYGCGKPILKPKKEPTIAKSATVEPVSTPNDLNQPNKENTHSLNDWRELGADEVIQEGDEYNGGNPKLNLWFPVPLDVVGEQWGLTKVRTRRPLPPVVDQSQSKWFKDGEKKQEEMPLEDERPLLKVMEYCRKWADQHLSDHGKETFYARLGLLVDFATDFYSDEIQKLKATVNKTTSNF